MQTISESWRNMFENYTFLEVLNLRSNQLKTMPEKIFRNQHELKYLYLHDNEIKDLPKLIFEHQTDLIILNLQKNYLWEIQFDFTHLTRMIAIDLSNNSITQLKVETQQNLDKLKSISPNFTTTLKGNPLECSCNTLQFLHWMQPTTEFYFS